MNPTSYARYNHNEKGMIFTKIRVGEMSNLSQWREKSMCHHLVLPNHFH